MCYPCFGSRCCSLIRKRIYLINVILSKDKLMCMSLLPQHFLQKKALISSEISWKELSGCQRWQKRTCEIESEGLTEDLFICLLFSLFGNYHIHHLLQSI